MSAARDRQLALAMVAHAAERHQDNRAALLDFMDTLDDVDLQVVSALLAQWLADGLTLRLLDREPELGHAKALGEIATAARHVALKYADEAGS